MSSQTIRRIHRVTALITCAAIAFCLFFQISKGGPFRAVNPFLEDPYDAVGSFAVQGALLISLLTYARALRLNTDPVQATKARLILRGNILVLLAMWATLIADGVAELVRPYPPSYWGKVLLTELEGMFLLAVLCVVALVAAFRRVSTAVPPCNLTPADGIDDLWTLVRIPITTLSVPLPRLLVGWVKRFDSDWLFAHVRWFDPRVHPWRFASVVGWLAGVGLVLMQLQEGLPPSLGVGLLLAGIFIAGELGATLLGFALLGGYLGLRPSRLGQCTSAGG